ncbi:hypothetical protein E2C01_064167 [Portunus trituberculatus]|uniref:Uncharacterized protein n=1 Tax=Portunus trituberculatus TaxID=210409 RepID=A0A5B7HN02_PORTR|nr:hypothetical protein [Portunus trituberculatus]
MTADKLTYILCSCDHRMLGYMAGVRLQDGRSSSEVPELMKNGGGKGDE